MKPRRRLPWQTYLRVAGSLVGVLLVVYLLAQQDWEELLSLFRRIGWGVLALSLVLTAGSRLAVAGRWHMLLQGVEPKVRLRDTFELTFAGLFASNFLPTTIGGDLVRLAGAFQLEIDRALSAASLIVDRLVGMAGMAIPLPFGLAAAVGSVTAWLPLGPLLQPVSATMAGVTSGGWVRKLAARIQSAVRRVWRALKLWLARPRSLGWALACTLGHMCFLFASIGLLLRAMGEPLGFLTIAGIWSLVYFITLFPISINGLGLQEAALTLAFTQLGGISTQAALVLAVCVRTLAMVASLPGALFIGKLLPQARQQLATGQSEGEQVA